MTALLCIGNALQIFREILRSYSLDGWDKSTNNSKKQGVSCSSKSCAKHTRKSIDKSAKNCWEKRKDVESTKRSSFQL